MSIEKRDLLIPIVLRGVRVDAAKKRGLVAKFQECEAFDGMKRDDALLRIDPKPPKWGRAFRHDTSSFAKGILLTILCENRIKINMQFSHILE